MYSVVTADKGKVLETGWIDISLPDNADSEREGLTDSKAIEQEPDLDLEGADHEEMFADDEEIPADVEGTKKNR